MLAHAPSFPFLASFRPPVVGRGETVRSILILFREWRTETKEIMDVVDGADALQVHPTVWAGDR